MRARIVLITCIAVATALAPGAAQDRGGPDIEIVQIAAAPPAGSRIARVGVDVTASPGLHVYAPGNPGYAPIELELDGVEGMRIRKVVLPTPHELLFNLSEPVLVYEGRFRAVLEVELSARQTATLAKTGELTLKGRLRYQACTETVCLRPVTTPLTWSISKGLSRLPQGRQDSPAVRVRDGEPRLPLMKNCRGSLSPVCAIP